MPDHIESNCIFKTVDPASFETKKIPDLAVIKVEDAEGWSGMTTTKKMITVTPNQIKDDCIFQTIDPAS